MLIRLTNTIGAIRKAIASIVRENLQLFIDFEKGGTDKSPNTNNATLYTGKALSFDGTNDYVELGNPSVNLKSICFWVDLDTTTEQIINLTSTHSIEAVSGTITLNGTWSNSNIYVDGVASTSIGTTVKRVVVTTDTNISVDDLEFGRIGSNYGSLDLSDVQIWDYELTQADVTFDYDNPQHLVTDRSGTSVTLSNLKGYWHLSEGAGGICYDSSGEGNNGTINGATHLTAQTTIPQLGLMDWAKSTPVSDEITLIADPNDPSNDILDNAVRLREHALNLDGSGLAEVADDDTLDFSGELTLEIWAKADYENVGSVFNGIFSMNGNIADATGLGFYTNTSKVYYRIGGSINSFTYTQYKCYYLAITRDSSNNFKFYKGDDGTISEVASGTNSTDFTSTLTKFIGRDSNAARNYPNLVDEPRAYNRGLSLDEIKRNYEAGINKHKNGSSFSDDFSSDYGF